MMSKGCDAHNIDASDKSFDKSQHLCMGYSTWPGICRSMSLRCWWLFRSQSDEWIRIELCMSATRTA